MCNCLPYTVSTGMHRSYPIYNCFMSSFWSNLRSWWPSLSTFWPTLPSWWPSLRNFSDFSIQKFKKWRYTGAGRRAPVRTGTRPVLGCLRVDKGFPYGGWHRFLVPKAPRFFFAISFCPIILFFVAPLFHCEYGMTCQNTKNGIQSHQSGKPHSDAMQKKKISQRKPLQVHFSSFEAWVHFLIR